MNRNKWLIRIVIMLLLASLIVWGVLTWRDASTAEYSPDVHVPEITRVFRPPVELGSVSYRMGGASSVLFFSSTYEALDADCVGQPLAELQLSDAPTGSLPEIAITTNSSANQYHYAHLVPGSTGRCTDNEPQKEQLYKAITTMVEKSTDE